MPSQEKKSRISGNEAAITFPHPFLHLVGVEEV